MKRLLAQFVTAALFTVAFLSLSVTAQDVGIITINELMADNETSVQDPAGEYDDWLELYNNSAVAVDLGGWYMSDDANELNEWAFPDGTSIEAHGYLIVWCDEDLEQEGFHADFKLSADGETVFLCTPELEITQEVTYGAAVMDESFSRVPDGTGDFVWKEHSFNEPNSASAIDEIITQAYLTCYPVPASEYVYIQPEFDENETLKIYSITGKAVWTGSINSITKINVQSWPKGMYVVSIENGVKNKIIIQ